MRKESRVFKKESDRHLYVRFMILLAAIIIILVLTYFIGIAILSNLSVFWGSPNYSTNRRLERIIPPPQIYSLPQATNSAILKVRGYSQPGSTVTLYINDNKVESLISSKDGQYAFDEVKLQSGENQIYVRAKNREGVESKPSPIQTVNLDIKPPRLKIISPTDNEIIEGDEETPTFVTVVGSVDEEAVVSVNEHRVILNEDNTFAYRLRLDKDGENVIKITATDRAGNKATAEKIVIHEKPTEDNEEKDSEDKS